MNLRRCMARCVGHDNERCKRRRGHHGAHWIRVRYGRLVWSSSTESGDSGAAS